MLSQLTFVKFLLNKKHEKNATVLVLAKFKISGVYLSKIFI